MQRYRLKGDHLLLWTFYFKAFREDLKQPLYLAHTQSHEVGIAFTFVAACLPTG
jgi:hypothetical protein